MPRNDENARRRNSEAMKRWHASQTPEQRAALRERIRVGTTAGMHEWHAQRTEAEREQSTQHIRDAALCRVWSPQRPGHKWQKGRGPVGNTTPEALARRSMTRVEAASVKRILKDIVAVQPELVRDAIIEGLLATPPRSFPYIALAAAYLDGKPIDAQPPVDNREDLSELTRDELLARALAIARRLKAEQAGELPVIDVIPEPSDETTK